jgi:hypothetical protein
MRRFITTFAVALTSATMLAMHAGAQSSETKTKIKTDDAQTVTYTGCVGSGTETRSYVLQNVQPISTTRTTTADGRVTTSTTYALVPGGTVELQQNVGRRVEVTGVLIPAGHGDAKITQRTKTNGKEEKTTTEVDKGAVPQLKVLSVKPTGGTC